ncbi:MAG TPA: glycosyltransferase N-terminal domain-containing protein [Lentimicrobium sp.]|nr:glycosyltransferase N-terminal domain-containing protein [Lentimicrobium sp.]
MRQIYNIIVGIYGFSLRIISVFNQKAKDWFYGRRNLFRKLEELFTIHYANENPSPVIWVHCASLGEYEQGRPVIQEIRKRFPGYLVLLTFFSPSGFNNKAQNSDADYVFYLPIDTIRNAKRFVRIVSPAIAIFVKYEFWFNYLNELHLNKIPVYTVSAIFRPDQHFFKWYGGWFRNHLRHLKMIFVQDQESAELLNMIDVNNVTICGDTRFDRVSGLLENPLEMPEISSFLSGSRTMVAGSTWPADEDLLKQLLISTDNFKIIIAPHEVTPHHISELCSKFNGISVLYSQITNHQNLNGKRVLIIDSIGLLSRLYRYGELAYIGGGFGVGIHNTLEAAVYGKPVIFGTNYNKFREARELIAIEAAVSIKTSDELIVEVHSFLKNSSRLESYSNAANKYVQDRRGATDIIIKELENYITNVLSV